MSFPPEDNPLSYMCCKGYWTEQCSDCGCQICPKSGYGQFYEISYDEEHIWSGCHSCCYRRIKEKEQNENITYMEASKNILKIK